MFDTGHVGGEVMTSGSCYTCVYGSEEAASAIGITIPEMGQDAGCQQPFKIGPSVVIKDCDFEAKKSCGVSMISLDDVYVPRWRRSSVSDNLELTS